MYIYIYILIFIYIYIHETSTSHTFLQDSANVWNHQKFQLFLSLPCVHRNEPRPCNTLWDHHEGTNPYLLVWICRVDAVGRCGDICIVPHLEGVVLKIFMYVVCCYALQCVFCALLLLLKLKNYTNT